MRSFPHGRERIKPRYSRHVFYIRLSLKVSIFRIVGFSILLLRFLPPQVFAGCPLRARPWGQTSEQGTAGPRPCGAAPWQQQGTRSGEVAEAEVKGAWQRNPRSDLQLPSLYSGRALLARADFYLPEVTS